jgi:hypothetical protein
MVERIGPSSRRAVIFGAVLVAVTGTVLPLRFYDDLHAMGSQCRKCRMAIPYEGLAKSLATRGFHQGTIIVQARHDAGNLRRYFPQSRIACLSNPRYAPPLPGKATGQVALVLNPRSRPRYLHDALRQAIALGATALGPPETVSVAWQPWPSSSPERSWSWTVLVADLGSPQN